MGVPAELLDRFQRALDELDARFAGASLADEDADAQLRGWLDKDVQPLPWTSPSRITEDEWFFITTLYGEMTLAGQKAHIRRFYPVLFVKAARRDIRNFDFGIKELSGLRAAWMAKRLCRMAEILRDRALSMAGYSSWLRELESQATPEDPTPALDAIVLDHRATGWKTLSVFVRDCVGGNSFPIDSRVEKELRRHNLPANERALVGLSLRVGRNPRQVARMFYTTGGQR